LNGGDNVDFFLDLLGELFNEHDFFEEFGKLTFTLGLLVNKSFPFLIRHRYRENYNVIHSLKTVHNYRSIGEMLLLWIMIAGIFLMDWQIHVPMYEEHIVLVIILSVVAYFFDRCDIFNEGIIIQGTYYYWEEIDGYKWEKNKLTIKPKKRKWNALLLSKRSWQVKKSKRSIVGKILKDHLELIEM